MSESDFQRVVREGVEGKPAADYGEPMLQFFAFGHLPQHLQAVSEPFCELAYKVCRELPRNPERSVCLRRLLEAKDCAVRALLYK